MNIRILGKNLELTKAIKDYVEKNVAKLEKIFDNIIEANVEVGKTTHHHKKGKIFRAEINLKVPRTLLRAEEEAEDLYQAIDLVKEEIERQLRKYKTRLRQDRR